MSNQLFLYDLWYMAAPGKEIRRGKMTAKKLLGQSYLLGRDDQGKPFAMRNVCPHRGIPLSYGNFDGCEVECCYHGWRFNTQGVCTAIPSLVSDQEVNLSRIKVPSFPCEEVQGNIWLYIPKPGSAIPDKLPEIPRVPELGDVGYQFVESSVFPCDIDHAVIGLMDPAHGPYVHRIWWWRTGKKTHEKTKAFAPFDLGFKMLRHKPSSNSRAYKLLGKDISTEISFVLPGVRIEHIKVGKSAICALTTLTPVTPTETIIYQFFYWNISWLKCLQPIIRSGARVFLNQDKMVVERQQEGLVDNPQLMLINDADKLAKWYYKLKKEFVNAKNDNREFSNPVPEIELRWTS